LVSAEVLAKDSPEGLYKYWMGHAGRDMSDLYDKVKDDVEFRRKWAERASWPGITITPSKIVAVNHINLLHFIVASPIRSLTNKLIYRADCGVREAITVHPAIV
jgi:hypothetical protein